MPIVCPSDCRGERNCIPRLSTGGFACNSPCFLRARDFGGVLSHYPIGPAIAHDVVRYARRRPDVDGLAEALEIFLLPQLEGLTPTAARKIHEMLREILVGSTPEVRTRFDNRFDDLFPGHNDQ